MLPKLFNERNGTAIKSSDVLVDVGCGRGRVINWWLSLGLGNKIVSWLPRLLPRGAILRMTQASQRRRAKPKYDGWPRRPKEGG